MEGEAKQEKNERKMRESPPQCVEWIKKKRKKDRKYYMYIYNISMPKTQNITKLLAHTQPHTH